MNCILSSVRDFLKTIKKVQRTVFMRTPLMIETSADTKTYLTTCEICKNKISKEYYYYVTHLKKDNINMCDVCSDILIKPFCDDGWKFIRFYSAF
jgi:predicted SprT family Zn-dependent metalloprotease